MISDQTAGNLDKAYRLMLEETTAAENAAHKRTAIESFRGFQNNKVVILKPLKTADISGPDKTLVLIWSGFFKVRLLYEKLI